MNKEPNSRGNRYTTMQKSIAALALVTAGTGLGIQFSRDNAPRSLPVYQPFNMDPTVGGSEVPEGYQAPVGETITVDPSDPNETHVTFGTTPDGQRPTTLQNVPQGVEIVPNGDGVDVIQH